MERAMSQQNPKNLVSRILQVALGLFVTTTDLPPYPNNHESLSYDCSFDSDCRWASIGNTMDHWRVARGEPESLLWLAATGTMQLPRDPFLLIEQRGNPVDVLMSDEIACQKEAADFSFVYWTIGNADLEICLTDVRGNPFNCTGMLASSVMPGKVYLKIPEMQRAYRIMISPNNLPGVLIIDDIRFNASICDRTIPSTPPGEDTTSRSVTSPTTTTVAAVPWTQSRPETTSLSTTSAETVIIPKTIPKGKGRSTFGATTFNKSIIERVTLPTPTTEVPFELMVYGNRTSPLFDRRTGTIIADSTRLLCDFNKEFACQWGAEAGKWAIIEQGAIPSLEESVADPSLLPSYPAALVLQGPSMLASDPVQCQTGPGKVLFRYWSNGGVILQVCILGYAADSQLAECVDENTSTIRDNKLVVFDLSNSVKEVFTINIVAHWREGVKNRYLVIDEVAYIGECSLPERPSVATTTTTSPQKNSTTDEVNMISIPGHIITLKPPRENNVIKPEGSRTLVSLGKGGKLWPTARVITLPPITRAVSSTAYPLPKGNPYSTHVASSKRKTGLLFEKTTSWPIPQKSTTRWITAVRTTTEEPESEDYCASLNCNFDENACSYLNHGLTIKPWTLRNRGYGYPLTGHADIRPTGANGQFVSTILGPGEIAILESPKVSATPSLNVLLFQYFRPSQTSTLRLCLGSHYTGLLRTVAAFMRCPAILRSVTSKNSLRWNTVHVQLPPGTTHFFLVAHNSDRSESQIAIALDNIRVAICDPREFAQKYLAKAETQQHHYADYEPGI